MTLGWILYFHSAQTRPLTARTFTPPVHSQFNSPCAPTVRAVIIPVKTWNWNCRIRIRYLSYNSPRAVIIPVKTWNWNCRIRIQQRNYNISTTYRPNGRKTTAKGPLIPRKEDSSPFSLLTHISCHHVKAFGRSRACHPPTFAGRWFARCIPGVFVWNIG